MYYKNKITLLTLAVVVVLILATVLPAFAAIDYTGQGTTGGDCNTKYDVNNPDNPPPPQDVPAGTMLWQFNLTSSSAGATLTASFSDGTNFGPDAGTQTGGVTKWYVATAYPATVSSASATGETDNSQLTVSHCWINPPVVKYWCSPGFWAQNPNAIPEEVSLGTLYSTIGGAPLKKGAPANPTIGEVLASPSTYGGPAFNSVANYISGIAFAPNGGTQETGENCPLNAHGEWIGD